MIWESQQSNSKNPENNENYTKHYVYEPKSFVPLLQTGYTGFIKLLETPDYVQFKHEDYSVYKDLIWKTETRKNKAELERVAFYHCDQVGMPQTLTNDLVSVFGKLNRILGAQLYQLRFQVACLIKPISDSKDNITIVKQDCIITDIVIMSHIVQGM